jgi:hypothetical protein
VKAGGARRVALDSVERPGLVESLGLVLPVAEIRENVQRLFQ